MKLATIFLLLGSISCLKEGEPCIGVDEKCDEGLFCCPSCGICKSNDLLDQMMKLTGAKDKQDLENMVKEREEKLLEEGEK